MKNMKKFFELDFIICCPSKEGREVDFVDKIEQIEDSIRIFNASYKDIKEIKLLNLEKQVIHLLVCFKNEEEDFKMNGRHLSFFSKRLYEIGWDKYSSVETKLFKTSHLDDVTKEYNDEKYEAIPVIPNNINRVLSYGEDGAILSNDQALLLFKNLCDTQDIGDAATKRRNKEVLYSIKSILYNWFK